MEIEQASISTASASTWRIRVDNNLNRAIIEVRSSEGQVVRQYPTEAQLKAFARAQALKTARHQEVNAELNAKLAGGSSKAQAKVTVDVQPAPATSSAPAPDSGSADASGGAASTQSIEV